MHSKIIELKPSKFLILSGGGVGVGGLLYERGEDASRLA